MQGLPCACNFVAAMTDWNTVLRCEPEEYASRVYDKRPAWIEGHIAWEDAKYLFGRAVRSGASLLLEIGTASGLSTALLCRAGDAAHRAGLIGPDYLVETFDIDEMFFADRSRRSGDAAREMLEPELLDHIRFNSPQTAVDFTRRAEEDSVEFAFVDAAHTHPWPALDLLTLLPVLRPGAEVILHDVNLPAQNHEHGDWGAKLVFDGLDVEKRLADEGDPPNIGSVFVPEDKGAVREQLLALVDEHEWETEIDDEVVRAATGSR